MTDSPIIPPKDVMKFRYFGHPVDIVSVAGNDEGELYGVEIINAGKQTFKLAFEGPNGAIRGLVDGFGQPVTRDCFAVYMPNKGRIN